jgi:heme A synthase
MSGRRAAFVPYAWGGLGGNLGVVLLGAYLRATGAGAGCGAHWPLCNGEVVPASAQTATLVEFSHRLSSGLSLVLIAGLVFWAFRAYPKGHVVRTGAVLSACFILLEALLGAGLVLLELVAQNASAERAVAVSLHLVNTFLLLGSLTLTAWWATTGATRARLGTPGPLRLAFLAAAVGTVFIGATGAIVALGDTLFPAGSLAEGLRQDVDPTVSFLIRLRVIHPAVAVLVGIGLIALASHVSQHSTSSDTRHAAGRLILLVFAQWLAGITNVFLLAPVWLQLMHLLLADLVWIALVCLAATTLSGAGEVEVSAEPAAVGP